VALSALIEIEVVSRKDDTNKLPIKYLYFNTFSSNVIIVNIIAIVISF
jgi:hypothetical protein